MSTHTLDLWKGQTLIRQQSYCCSTPAMSSKSFWFRQLQNARNFFSIVACSISSNYLIGRRNVSILGSQFTKKTTFPLLHWERNPQYVKHTASQKQNHEEKISSLMNSVHNLEKEDYLKLNYQHADYYHHSDAFQVEHPPLLG